MHAVMWALVIGCVIGLWVGYKIGRGVAPYMIAKDIVDKLKGK